MLSKIKSNPVRSLEEQQRAVLAQANQTEANQRLKSYHELQLQDRDQEDEDLDRDREQEDEVETEEEQDQDQTNEDREENKVVNFGQYKRSEGADETEIEQEDRHPNEMIKREDENLNLEPERDGEQEGENEEAGSDQLDGELSIDCNDDKDDDLSEPEGLLRVADDDDDDDDLAQADNEDLASIKSGDTNNNHERADQRNIRLTSTTSAKRKKKEPGDEATGTGSVSQDELLEIVENSRRRRLSQDSANSLSQFISWSFANIQEPQKQQQFLLRQQLDLATEDQSQVEAANEEQDDWLTTNELMRRQLRALKPADLVLQQTEAKLSSSIDQQGAKTAGSDQLSRLKSHLSGRAQLSSPPREAHDLSARATKRARVTGLGPSANLQNAGLKSLASASQLRNSQQRAPNFLGNVVQRLHIEQQQRQFQQQHDLHQIQFQENHHLQQFLEQQRNRNEQQTNNEENNMQPTVADEQTSNQLALAAAIQRALIDSCHQLPINANDQQLGGADSSGSKSTASSTASSSTGDASSSLNMSLNQNQNQHPSHQQQQTNSNNNTNSSSTHNHNTNPNSNLHHLLALNDLTRSLHNNQQQRRIYNTRHSVAAAAAAASSSINNHNNNHYQHHLGHDQHHRAPIEVAGLTQQQQQLLVSAAAVATNRVQQQRHAQAAAALSALAASAGQADGRQSSLHQQAAALLQGAAVAASAVANNPSSQHSNQQLNHQLNSGLSHNNNNNHHHHHHHHHQQQSIASAFGQPHNQHHQHPNLAATQLNVANAAAAAALLNIDFKCDICPSSFDDRHRLMQHQSIHLELKKEWFTETPVDEVMKIFNRRRGEFLCNLCNLRFEATLDYDQHNHEHHGARPYCCQFCGNGTRTFKCWRQYLNHLYDHRYIFSCTIENCDFTVNRRDSLRFHIFRFHLNCQLPQQLQLQQQKTPSGHPIEANILGRNKLNNNNNNPNNNNNSILQANYHKQHQQQLLSTTRAALNSILTSSSDHQLDVGRVVVVAPEEVDHLHNQDSSSDISSSG